MPPQKRCFVAVTLTLLRPMAIMGRWQAAFEEAKQSSRKDYPLLKSLKHQMTVQHQINDDAAEVAPISCLLLRRTAEGHDACWLHV